MGHQTPQPEPTLSDAPGDKLKAALLRVWDDPARDFPDDYVEACARWFAGLSERDKGIAARAVWAYAGGDEPEAARIAAALPRAPSVPL